MSKSITISFYGTTEQKELLEQWATQDDRSVSYIMRQILNREAQRRKHGGAEQPEQDKASLHVQTNSAQ
jgi:hypothetical protein